jgi:hypothetical protein
MRGGIVEQPEAGAGQQGVRRKMHVEIEKGMDDLRTGNRKGPEQNRPGIAPECRDIPVVTGITFHLKETAGTDPEVHREKNQ